MDKLLETYSYTIAGSRLFAELSGDFNPIHLDPITARRELYGEVVLHGMHGVCRALNVYLAQRAGHPAISLTGLNVRFLGPIFLDRPIGMVLTEERAGYAKLQLCDADRATTVIEIRWNTAPESFSAEHGLPQLNVGSRLPRNFEIADILNRRGEVELFINANQLAKMFPDLADAISLLEIAEILALTRLVGMECPGLRSVFSAFNISFKSTSGDHALKYCVTESDPRFGMVKISVTGLSLTGSVDAFFRPGPRIQAGIAVVQKRIITGEFSNQVALIIGGTRGLGEMAAKIICLGGGQAVITYQCGKDDAVRLAAELSAAGGCCRILEVDVKKPAAAIEELAQSQFPLTHIYYFASPRIFYKKAAQFNSSLFRSFLDVYAEGFYEVYRNCRSHWKTSIKMFYPSTTFLDQRVADFAEYACAKAAGETLGGYLMLLDRKLSVLVKRLPRIATDQTNAIIPVESADALDVMLPIVRELNQ